MTHSAERHAEPAGSARLTLLGAAVVLGGLVFGAVLSSVALCALWWHTIVSSAAGVAGCA